MWLGNGSILDLVHGVIPTFLSHVVSFHPGCGWNLFTLVLLSVRIVASFAFIKFSVFSSTTFILEVFENLLAIGFAIVLTRTGGGRRGRSSPSAAFGLAAAVLALAGGRGRGR